MRDPDLVQRAERASVLLEQAWERWREVHGLGAEPLPPVSSYVGYSLEEPWGQPRVVFGLRADEAELLASQLDGHECVGSVYAEATARSEWRNPVALRAYGDTFSVPAQARPPTADLIGPGAVADYADLPRPDRGQREPAGETDQGRRGTTARRRPTGGRVPMAAEDAVSEDEGRWNGLLGDPLGQAGGEVGAARASITNSPPLAPLPPVADFPMRPDYLAAEATGLEAASETGIGPVSAPAQGPGYRGQRYQGFPPRYEPGLEPLAAAPEPALADDDGARDDAEPGTSAPPQVARLSRPPRKRTKTARPAAKPSVPDAQSEPDEPR